MGKAMIIEAQDSNTVYEEGKSKGILGKLKGIFADFKHGTRNADRLYSEELWDNRVFNNEDVMEALETKTLFGELDHPEGDRCETLAKNAAITITKLEKRPEEGVVYGEAEILDTPTGRVVKALADSGAKLGISSRGIGEEIYENGQNIIDPETYDFITFDVVVTPANKKARVALAESKHINKLNESFEKAINESKTKNQLDQIRIAIDNTMHINKTSLLNLIESKINTINKSDTKLFESNKEIALQLLKDKLKNNDIQLNESLKANEDLANENKQLIEDLDFYKTSKGNLKCKLKENLSTVNELKSKLNEAETKINDLDKSLKDKELEFKEKSLKEQNIHKTRLKILELKFQKSIESNNKLKDENTKLMEEKADLNKKLEAQSKIILEHKDKLDQLNKSKLIENKKVEQLNKSKDLEIQKLKEQINVLQARAKKTENIENRFSKLAFNPINNISNVKVLTENFESNLSEEDLDLFNALTNKQ